MYFVLFSSFLSAPVGCQDYYVHVFEGATAIVESGIMLRLPNDAHGFVNDAGLFPSYKTQNLISENLTWLIIVVVRWTGR